MFIVKEPGSDKWIAPETRSGFSSNRDDARHFISYAEIEVFLKNDDRYRGLDIRDIRVIFSLKKSSSMNAWSVDDVEFHDDEEAPKDRLIRLTAIAVLQQLLVDMSSVDQILKELGYFDDIPFQEFIDRARKSIVTVQQERT